jgi:cytochrome c biogenesis protein ResB
MNKGLSTYRIDTNHMIQLVFGSKAIYGPVGQQDGGSAHTENAIRYSKKKKEPMNHLYRRFLIQRISHPSCISSTLLCHYQDTNFEQCFPY